MAIAVALAGAALVVLVFVDLARTTMTVAGGGWLSALVSRSVAGSLRALGHRGLGRTALRAAGPLTSMLLFAGWFALLWLGWTLVFLGSGTAVVDDASRQAADLGGRLYFVGFSIITLGIGDLVPQGAGWRVLTVVASASGFFLVSMVITYTVSVIGALVDRHALAQAIHDLGATPAAIATLAASERDGDALGSQLYTLHHQLEQVRQQHLAYPLLYRFHPPDAGVSLASALALLADALLVLQAAVAERQRPSRAVLAPLQVSIDALLDTLEDARVRPAACPLPDPPLPAEAADGAGSRLQALLAERRRQRCLLRGWLEQEGWRTEHFVRGEHGNQGRRGDG